MCNQCLELEPVTATLCEEAELEPNKYMANFCFSVPKGFKACKPNDLHVSSPDVKIEVESYEIDESGVTSDKVCVAISITPPNGYNFAGLGATGFVTLCKEGEMICREFDIIPQVCDNCLDEVHTEAHCADNNLSDNIHIYQGTITVSLPTGFTFCGYNSPLTGFEVLGTPSANPGMPNETWTVNYRITTVNKKLMHTTALLCFSIGNIKYCIPVDITIVPCQLPDDCVAAWTPKYMSCTRTENGEHIFNIKKQVYAGPYALCGGGLFGTVDSGYVTISGTPTVFFSVFTFDIDIHIPISKFVNGGTYNLKLYLCDHLGNIVCYHFPFVLACGSGFGAGGGQDRDAVKKDGLNGQKTGKPVCTILPNPASDQIVVITEGFDPEKQREARLLDHTGRLLSTTRLHNEAETISVANLQPGVYIVIVLEDGLPVKEEKVVIVR
ncbi:MAG: T9SS type A sorting domain-containing protein [Saprospiraceae bacterium]